MCTNGVKRGDSSQLCIAWTTRQAQRWNSSSQSRTQEFNTHPQDDTAPQRRKQFKLISRVSNPPQHPCHPSFQSHTGAGYCRRLIYVSTSSAHAGKIPNYRRGRQWKEISISTRLPLRRQARLCSCMRGRKTDQHSATTQRRHGTLDHV